jgi:hypothetical protein
MRMGDVKTKGRRTAILIAIGSFAALGFAAFIYRAQIAERTSD